MDHRPEDLCRRRQQNAALTALHRVLRQRWLLFAFLSVQSSKKIARSNVKADQSLGANSFGVLAQCLPSCSACSSLPSKSTT